MKLDEGMGFGDHNGRTKRNPLLGWPLLVAIVCAVIVIGLIVSSVVSATRKTATAEPDAGAPPAPIPTASPSARATATPQPTPTGTATPAIGTDATDGAGAPVEAWTAFDRFMVAWSSTDPGKRSAGLAETATADLAAGLADTRPENIVVAQRTGTTIVGSSSYSIEWRTTFAAVPGSVHTISVADPGSPYGWRVSRIEKRID